MYFRNKVGSVVKTVDGVIYEDETSIRTIVIKESEDKQELIDSTFERQKEKLEFWGALVRRIE